MSRKKRPDKYEFATDLSQGFPLPNNNHMPTLAVFEDNPDCIDMLEEEMGYLLPNGEDPRFPDH